MLKPLGPQIPDALAAPLVRRAFSWCLMQIILLFIINTKFDHPIIVEVHTCEFVGLVFAFVCVCVGGKRARVMMGMLI